jgi:hypothetical protein
VWIYPLFVAVSFVGTDELIQEAGADAEGMVITQVVPPYYLTDLKTVALYRRTLEKFEPGSRPNFVSLGRLRGCDGPSVVSQLILCNGAPCRG